MEILLETERLQLRRFTSTDVDHLVALDSDPEVMRFLNGGRPTPRAVVVAEILPRFLRAYGRGEGWGFWAAVEKTSREFVGWFSLRPRETCSSDAELGYRLRHVFWGRGLATEGSRALIRRGFTELGVRRVTATTYEDNRASRRVMEKCGLTLVRTYRMTAAELVAGATYGVSDMELFQGEDVEYALERAEWERQRSLTLPEPPRPPSPAPSPGCA